MTQVFVVLLTLLVAQSATAQGAATININAGQPGVRIGSNLFGVFFEEINCAGDAGRVVEHTQQPPPVRLDFREGQRFYRLVR